MVDLGSSRRRSGIADATTVVMMREEGLEAHDFRFSFASDTTSDGSEPMMLLKARPVELVLPPFELPLLSFAAEYAGGVSLVRDSGDVDAVAVPATGTMRVRENWLLAAAAERRRALEPDASGTRIQAVLRPALRMMDVHAGKKDDSSFCEGSGAVTPGGQKAALVALGPDNDALLVNPVDEVPNSEAGQGTQLLPLDDDWYSPAGHGAHAVRSAVDA